MEIETALRISTVKMKAYEQCEEQQFQVSINKPAVITLHMYIDGNRDHYVQTLPSAKLKHTEKSLVSVNIDSGASSGTIPKQTRDQLQVHGQLRDSSQHKRETDTSCFWGAVAIHGRY